MTLYRFGRELSKVIVIDNKKQQRKQLRTLRNDFSSFTVLYRFPMPSNQQQSIEMYEINRKFFDLDNFFYEIQQEIDNTHEFLETVEANRLASAANSLATWGIPLATAALITGLFSMNDVNLLQCGLGGLECQMNKDLLFQVLVVVATGFGLRSIMKNKDN